MADNIELNVGTSGAILAADDIASVWYQRVKLINGTDGQTNAIATGDGTNTDAMRVTVATDSSSLTVDNAGLTELAAAINASSQMDVNLAASAATVTVDGSGVTQPVSNAGTFAVQVSDTSFAVADGNALGEGVLIQGDDGTDRKNINVDATTGDVQVDVTNTVTVDGSGVTQPVSGTVTANLSATDNAVLDNIQTSVDTVAAAVSTEMQVDVVGALPTGTNVIGALGASASGGMSYDMLAMAAEDNDKIIKGSAGTVYFVSVQSLDATPVYLKLFDAASITPGTTSADLQFLCPTQGDGNGAGLVLNFGAQGIQFSTGICALVATGIALDDNTAVSANEVIVTIGFE